MRSMKGLELGKRNQLLQLPRGLVYCFDTDLTPGSSHYQIALPTNIANFTSVTYAIAFSTTTSTSNAFRDLLNNATDESPRILFNPSNGIIQFYYIGESPFFDNGFNSMNNSVLIGAKNIFIGTINDTILNGWINGNNAVNLAFTTGTPRIDNWNKGYRLSGLANDTNLFDGTYNFFGIWNRALSNMEVGTLNQLLRIK